MDSEITHEEVFTTAFNNTLNSVLDLSYFGRSLCMFIRPTSVSEAVRPIPPRWKEDATIDDLDCMDFDSQDMSGSHSERTCGAHRPFHFNPITAPQLQDDTHTQRMQSGIGAKHSSDYERTAHSQTHQISHANTQPHTPTRNYTHTHTHTHTERDIEQYCLMYYEALMGKLKIPHGVEEQQLRLHTLKESGPNALQYEKKPIKNELRNFDIKFEKQFKRQPQRRDKEVLRPLYLYYKRLKDEIGKLQRVHDIYKSRGQNPHENEKLAPVGTPPGEIASLANNTHTHRSGSPGDPQKDRVRLEKLYAQKTRIRQILHTYQEEFMAMYGRKIKYHRDIMNIDKEYKQYKLIKQEITRLEQTMALGRA